MEVDTALIARDHGDVLCFFILGNHAFPKTTLPLTALEQRNQDVPLSKGRITMNGAHVFCDKALLAQFGLRKVLVKSIYEMVRWNTSFFHF